MSSAMVCCRRSVAWRRRVTTHCDLARTRLRTATRIGRSPQSATARYRSTHSRSETHRATSSRVAASGCSRPLTVPTPFEFAAVAGRDAGGGHDADGARRDDGVRGGGEASRQRNGAMRSEGQRSEGTRKWGVAQTRGALPRLPTGGARGVGSDADATTGSPRCRADRRRPAVRPAVGRSRARQPEIHISAMRRWLALSFSRPNSSLISPGVSTSHCRSPLRSLRCSGIHSVWRSPAGASG